MELWKRFEGGSRCRAGFKVGEMAHYKRKKSCRFIPEQWASEFPNQLWRLLSSRQAAARKAQRNCEWCAGGFGVAESAGQWRAGEYVA